MKRGTFFVVVIITIVCSCGIDVTMDPSFNYGYQKGQVYVTIVKLYLTKDPPNLLKLPGELSPRIRQYIEEPIRYSNIKGVIEKNEQIEIVKLIYKESFESSYLEVYGKIITGEYEGEIVNLILISNYESKQYPDGGSMSMPNPELIKLIR